jgi:YidC/Oxa1 family membrane protein insertase
LIITMSLTTFITQKQIMARNGPADPQQQNIQRILLYASPLFLAVFGFNFPIAVLLYWLTTNAWSMGQQHFIIKRMPPLQIGKANSPVAAAAPSGGLTSLLKGHKNEPPAEPVAPTRLTQVRQTPPASSSPSSPSEAGSGSGSGAGSPSGPASNGSNGARSVKPAQAPPGRPAARTGAKKRGGKGGSRRGGRR